MAIIASGNWWRLEDDGTLYVYCTGDMSSRKWGDYTSDIVVVIIQNGVTSISSSAFSGCSGLTSVTIPDSVTSIGSNMFRGCSGLTSVTIPDSVTSIGDSVFYNCNALTDVYYGGSQAQWEAISISATGNRPLTSATIHYATQAVTLESIAITTPPAKTAYTEGETFDAAGMVVTATYSDGTTATVADYTFSPSGSLATADTAITIRYTEGGMTESAAVSITVTAQSAPTPEPVAAGRITYAGQSKVIRRLCAVVNSLYDELESVKAELAELKAGGE